MLQLRDVYNMVGLVIFFCFVIISSLGNLGIVSGGAQKCLRGCGAETSLMRPVMVWSLNFAGRVPVIVGRATLEVWLTRVDLASMLLSSASIVCFLLNIFPLAFFFLCPITNRLVLNGMLAFSCQKLMICVLFS